MGLTDIMLAKIKEEITNDPDNVGYATAKDDKELMDMLNSPYTKEHTVVETCTAPIARIMVSLADAPNILVDEAEVTLAKTK